MADRDFLKLLPSLAISATSSHSPLPKTEIQVPVLKAKLASNQIIESLVLRSEPRVDTESKGGQFRFQLDLQTSAGVLKLVSDRNFESGSVLLLKFDLQGRPEVVVPDTPELKAVQLKAAVQQLLIQNLPLIDSKSQWIRSIETTLNALPQSILPKSTLALLNTLVNYKTLSPGNLHQWNSLDFLKATTRSERLVSAQSIQSTIKQLTSESALKTGQDNTGKSQTQGSSTIASTNVSTAPSLSPDTGNSQTLAGRQLKAETLNSLLTTMAINGNTKSSVTGGEKTENALLATSAKTFDKTALVREVLANYAKHYHNTTQNQPLPKNLQTVLNAGASLTPNQPDNHQSAAQTNPPVSNQKPETATSGVKELFSQTVINMLTQNLGDGTQNKNTGPSEKILANASLEITSRLNEAFVSSGATQKQPIPLNILLYLLQTDLRSVLSHRPDSVALQLQAKAARIMAENQNTYSPAKLGKTGIPLGPRVTAETRLLDTLLTDIRTGIARNHVQILNQLNGQLLTDVEKPSFNSIELPIFLPGLTETAILEVRQEGSTKNKQGALNHKHWHFRFHVDFQPLPPCCMEIFYQPSGKGSGSLTLWFWSKDPTSLQLFSDYQEVLASSLRQKGFDITACTGKMGLPEKSKGNVNETTNLVDIRT